ncbi:hypothetical protein V6U90_08730 [Micromonospora sp. CPCC 206060]|uniref:hypothetical protein n=1 Tax=Micromonospora sp. CPCC 206060 TaxID=3122406 RepID=UPI002FF0B961
MRVPDQAVRGRRCAVLVALAAVLAVTVAPGAAVGAPTAMAPTGAVPVCQVRDGRLNEISGLVATDAGFVVVNDGADDESHRRIFFLDRRCAVVRTLPFPSRPRDTEDLAVGADGTIWVGDIGDNGRARETIAVWKLAPRASRPVLYRMTYPDGPHDAEALLVTRDGLPVIVTKQSGGAGLYTPVGPLRRDATVPLVEVGRVRLPGTTTSNPFSFLGRRLVTGAATAPDGSRVVLRTYADAFEFDVSGGAVIAALTRGTPRVTALPDEPQGEAVSYSRDGRSLLTVSESAGQPPGTRPTVLRYALTPVPSPTPRRDTPAPTVTRRDAPAPTATRAADAADRAGPRDTTRAVVVGGLGLLALALVAAVRTRRGRR